ncbi:hypothetical protein CABS03_02353 [Colletotrichum abscissum]|uniref:Uncharacterized protein n=1 Tax=Colletotrichum abscissum TaxID=1671311 RepID=A0A9Q0AWK0_9PEZI|nr:hypothetical protein CABS02_11236 [Colletotrichum abscissum]
MLFCWTTLRRYRHFRCSTIILAARQKVDTPELSKSTGIQQLHPLLEGIDGAAAAATTSHRSRLLTSPGWTVGC